MSRTINTKAEWDALPVGTSVAGFRAGFRRAGSERTAVTATRGTEHGLHIDGLHFTAGGSFWSHLWPWVLDATLESQLVVTDPSGSYAITDEDINAVETAAGAWLERQDSLASDAREARRARSLPILEALIARGWTPPARKEG